MLPEIETSLALLSDLNPGFKKNREITPKERDGKLKKVLIANRGEIAKRFFLSLREERIPSVAIVTDADLGQSWYEFADEYIRIGDISNYTNIPLVTCSALLAKANAIYPGYGFLSENPNFVKFIKKASQDTGQELFFMGPDDSVMDRVGEKLSARALAKEHGVPLFEGSESIEELNQAKSISSKIGYPVIVKLSNGGGGKGMMPVFQESELYFAIESAKRIGKSLYNDDTFYIEKYITKPVHLEVQIFNGTAVGIRKCAVQRRNQKVVEETGDVFINDYTILSLLAAAENMAKISGYADGCGAGTVEFLYDQDSGNIGFLEMNTRLQVEHPVTDQSLGIDLAKWQILLYDGRESEIDYKNILEKRFTAKDHAIECRIYAEDPESGYSPSPGTIHELELPTFNGTRCDFGFRKGDQILPHYDPMIGKVITRGKTREIAISRMERALSELYIKGLTTNVNQLLNIMRDPEYLDGNYSNRLLDDNKELEKPTVQSGDATLASIFSALCENYRRIKNIARDSFFSGDLERSIHNSGTTKIPSKFIVETGEYNNSIQLIQTGIHSFHVFLNETHLGEAQITTKPSSEDDYLIRFGLRSYSVRIDFRPTYSLIRIKNIKNKISYYRVKVFAEGLGDKLDPPGMQRAPFQGSFVKFGRDEKAHRDRLSIGSYVKKGDPVIIISAMKMETVISAPMDGKIEYLIDDGDLSKLQIGETPQGQIIGKNIQEGEILFTIKPETADTGKTEEKTEKTSQIHIPTPVSNISPTLETIIKKQEKRSDIELPILLSILKAYYLGFSLEEENLNLILDIIENKEYSDIKEIEKDQVLSEIYKALGIYMNIKRLYAPSVGQNISLFNELNEYIKFWNDESFSPSIVFKYNMSSLFKNYDVDKWLGITDNNPHNVQIALFYMQRSYNNISQESRIFNTMLTIIEKFETSSHKKTIGILKKLYSIEEAEKDDTKAESIRKLLQKFHASTEKTSEKKPISRKYLNEFKIFQKDAIFFFAGNESSRRNAWIEKITQSLKESKELIPEHYPENDWFTQETKKKLALISKNFSIYKLHSPLGDLSAFSLVSRKDNNDKRYLLFYYIRKIDRDLDSQGRIIGSLNSERATIESSLLLKNYQSIEERSNNQIEILADEEPTLVDLGSSRNDIFTFESLFQVNLNVNHFLKDLSVTKMIVHLLCQSPYGGSANKKMFQLSVKNGIIVPDLVVPTDTNNLYYEEGVTPQTMRILDRDKWPIEFWVQECFRQGTYKEISIPSIDQIKWVNPKTGKEEDKPVGGKIFLGIMGQQHCLFYMKDSRINGGATGNLEGLKYLSALFLGYRWNVPVYIWNDGAGANIKEGMISLNRAGQGFMMNSLLTGPKDLLKFNAFTLNNPDPTLKRLFSELDTTIVNQEKDLQKSKTVLIAVGVGSSTGLDVYGSSQAAIQIMVDTEESYRVLTGSNVIKSVMGEDYTNYQIGGAKVMGKWTGTVDMVANNKIHLISILRQIQRLFAPWNPNPITKLSIPSYPTPSNMVIQEGSLLANLDDGLFIPFKEEYYGSGSLLGGFGRLNHVPICILGARTHYGIRSFATVTRAKELSLIANKTHSDKILIFGKRWFYQYQNLDAQTTRARKDFLNQYSKGSGMNIHIVKDLSGLERAPIHSLSDIIIFCNKEDLSKENYNFASKSSTFICSDIIESFQVAGKILEMVRFPEILDRTKISPPQEKPCIPGDPTQPFDMLMDVIHRTFDTDSFLEFYKEMNDPMNGPSLLTGLARLDGQTVGVIADQPIIMGGAPDAPGTEKYRIFTDFCNKFKLPIVMLSNAPGFLPGTKQERLRIQQIGGESLDSNILGEVPVVSVVLNQNYGGRQIHAFSKAIRPGIVYLALKNAVMAVMGGSASFDLFMGSKYNQLLDEGKKQEAIDLKDKYLKDYNTKSSAGQDAYQTGILDGLIEEIGDLRQALMDGLKAAEQQAKEFFGWIRN